jgi:hypothetical protein
MQTTWGQTTSQGGSRAGLPAQPHGQPTGRTLSQFGPGLSGYVHTSVQKRILCLRVSGNREGWMTGHVDGRPDVDHLQTGLIKLVKAPLYPNIRIPMVEFTHTRLFM